MMSILVNSRSCTKSCGVKSSREWEASLPSWRITRENLSQILYEVAMQGLRELDGLEEVDGEQSIIKIII